MKPVVLVKRNEDKETDAMKNTRGSGLEHSHQDARTSALDPISYAFSA